MIEKSIAIESRIINAEKKYLEKINLFSFLIHTPPQNQITYFSLKNGISADAPMPSKLILKL